MHKRTLTSTIAALGIFAAVGLIAGLAPSISWPSPAYAQNTEGTVATDTAALMALYNSAGGARWENNTNWGTIEPLDTWFGVTTDTSGRVTGLNLYTQNLSGTLLAELANLTNLSVLQLGGNQLRGNIPRSLGNLHQLETLSLRSNRLHGPIPDLSRLANLQHLSISGNQLSGNIPDWLGSLTNLRVLSLWGNKLSGELPRSLGNLTNLQELYLRSNRLSGPIPDLSRLTNLRELHLHHNQLSGELPHSLGSLTNLQELFLDDNQFTGPIPDSLGNLTNLQILSLWSNQLSGELPDSLGNLSNLQQLYLRSNRFSGPIPDLSRLTNLRELHLHHNQLSGEIPPWLGNLTNLQELILDDNQLTDEIPDSLGNLTNLRYLFLWSNQLTGEIPSWLGSLTNLQQLYLDDNQLTGEIPDSLGNLTNLEHLYLWSNQLTGPIPDSLSNLTNLQYLHLDHNQLSGEIPSWLGRHTDLQQLFLDENQFSGEIPDSLGNLTNLEHLYLWGNQLRGPIPDLSRLTNLQYLHFDHNELSGPIPDQGNLTNLQQLYLDDNQLTGEIPPWLGSLTNLEELSLWGNELTGPIPDQSRLNNLTLLFLWGNQLTGEIPASLGSLRHLETLSLRNNMLSGSIPEALGNLTALRASRFAGNSLTGCVPYGLRFLLTAGEAEPGVPAHDFFSPGLNLPFCMLSGLALSRVTLEPAFASGTETYTASVAHNVIATRVTTTLNDTNYTMSVMKGTDTYTSAESVPLDVGPNVITIAVTPADGTLTQTYTVTVTREAGPTPPGPLFSGQIAGASSVTGMVAPEGTTLGLNGGAYQPGGVYVNFPPTTVDTPVNVSVSVSNEIPSDVTAPSGTTLLPLTVDITPATPLTMGEPLTIEINPTSEQLAAVGGNLNHLSVGVVTPKGIQTLPVQVVNDRLLVTTDRLSRLVLLAVTKPGPTMTQPPMNDTSSTGPLLQWTQPAGTTWFQVQVIPFNEDGPGINLVIGDRAQVRAAQYQVLGPNFGSADPSYVLLPDMTYLWRVRTTTVTTNPTEADWSAWAVSSFKTPPASSSTITPVAPPVFGEVSTLTPTLTWANSNAAVFYYEVQVSRDYAFGPNAFLYSEYVHGGASTPPNSYVVPAAFPLEAGEIYYWRVRPRIQGDGAPLPWSTTYVFLTPKK